jgi:hypothetical protein
MCFERLKFGVKRDPIGRIWKAMNGLTVLGIPIGVYGVERSRVRAGIGLFHGQGVLGSGGRQRCSKTDLLFGTIRGEAFEVGTTNWSI